MSKLYAVAFIVVFHMPMETWADDYLNYSNITVSLGAGMAAEPFANRTTAETLVSLIDADSPADYEFHSQSTHIWLSGGSLSLDFRFADDYDINTLHFWNHSSEIYDVDRIELTFLSAEGATVSFVTIEDPELGLAGAVNGAIYAQDFDLSVNGVRSVLAQITGSNNQVDFQNIGFTGTATSGGAEECLVDATANQYILPSNQFALLSLPCVPPSGTTVADLFADDIGGALNVDWAMYTYEPNGGTPRYKPAALTDTINANNGFWLIQVTGTSVALDMPEGSKKHPTEPASGSACTGNLGCRAIPLSGVSHHPSSTSNTSNRRHWNIIANPTSGSESLVSTSDIRITSESGECSLDNQGCTLDQAFETNLVGNVLYAFQPPATTYAAVGMEANMEPWAGYWIVELPEASGNSPTVYFPKN